MAAPKPGDRVRITYVGTARQVGNAPLFVASSKGYICHVPDDATVEILPKPVYVNSDTTEYRDGDVIRSATTGKAYHRIWGEWRTADGEIFDGFGPQMVPLTLLVRDGQVVQS